MRNGVIIVRIISGGQRMNVDAPLTVATIPNASKTSSVILPALMAFSMKLKHESRYSSISVPPLTGIT